MSSPQFRLTLFAAFELTGRDGVVDLPSKKLAALLAYLACTAPQAQPGERLSTLLWGSHLDAQAKQNLRQVLFRLRKVVGQNALESDAVEIGCTTQRVTAALMDQGRRYRSMRPSSYAMSAGSRL